MIRPSATRMGACRPGVLVLLLVVCTGVGGGAVAEDAVAPGAIAFGPYVQKVTRSTASIFWWTRTGESVFQRASGPEAIRGYEQHSIRLNHLKPDTTYPYDVLGGGAEEGKGSFKTFPRRVKPFRFVAFGDTRSRHGVHEQIVNKIATEGPLFVINTGDLVSDGLDMNHWEVFFRVNRELMRSVPYYPALGNHERDSEYYFDFFDLPGNERYYTFSVGDVLIMILDTEGEEFSTPAYVKRAERSEFARGYLEPYMERQKAWVERRLSLHHDAGFIFVGFHKPVYSANPARVEAAATTRAFWGDLFERHGVQVVFSGHDHHYHHAVHGGTHYVVTGGGGAGLYDTDAPQPETVKAVKAEHYIRVDVGRSEAVLTAVGLDDSPLDTFVVKRRVGF